ncbi:hypothetical protein V6N13_029940 [Hibiscus sabdariffa]|uniref:RNase H type-1 domain-containing protein n=1 Tax=Hibiscus sabdariffa TaxID=183260 RepID=A0ABR2AI80_9ROSI
MFKAEVVAAVQGLEYFIDLVLSEQMVEGDSRAVIQNLQEDGDNSSTIQPFIANAHQLSRSLCRCRFIFTGCSGNSAAHVMAFVGQSSSKNRFWVEDAPDLTASAVASDRRAIDPP